MKLTSWLAPIVLLAATTAHADTYTYRYVGPTFTGGADHVEVVFTTSAPLAPGRSYLSGSDAGVISGSVTATGPNGAVSGFPVPITTFQIHTNASATTTVPGIDAWFVFGDANTLSGTAPTMTGYDYQAYTMNTMTFIPGSDIPGATGLVTGNYNYDQATQTVFYTSCSGVPNCTLAGNGQPYVSTYGGIINPSNTGLSNWSITVNPTTPPPTAPLSLTMSLPDATVGVSYTVSPTASGGVSPYTWKATGLPSGLSINTSTGQISGTPTTAGSSAVTVSVSDSASPTNTAQASATLVVGSATTTSYSCSKPAGASGFQIKGKITKIGAGYIVVGSTVVQTPSCTTVSWNGANGFAVGQRADCQGYKSGGVAVATKITIN